MSNPTKKIYAGIQKQVNQKRSLDLEIIFSTKKKCLRLERHFWFNLVYDYKAELTVLIILAAILYGSPLDAGLLSSNHPFHPF